MGVSLAAFSYHWKLNHVIAAISFFDWFRPFHPLPQVRK
jgi:hypothetical protein